jgi:hypothetical protein
MRSRTQAAPINKSWNPVDSQTIAAKIAMNVP